MLVQPVQAWGPYTTIYLNEEMKKDPDFKSSSIGQTSIREWDTFQACAVLTDISVVYYMFEGHKYEATHNHRFADAILADASDDRMKACAYGVEIGHLIGDSVAHNQWIPKKIRESSIPNIPMHPLVEAAVEAQIIRDHPEIFAQGRGVLDVVVNDDAFLDEIQSYITSSSGVVLDVKKETKFFQDVMGSEEGFYSRAFVLPEIYKVVGYGYWQLGVSLFLVIAGVAAFLISRSRLAILVSILPFLFTILLIAIGMMGIMDIVTVAFFWGVSLALSWFFIRRKYSRIIPLFWLGFVAVGAFLLTFGGLANWVDTSDADFYLDQSIDNQVLISQQHGWPTRYKYDPTGFASLSEADSAVIFVDAISIALIAGIIVFLTWFFRWRKR